LDAAVAECRRFTVFKNGAVFTAAVEIEGRAITLSRADAKVVREREVTMRQRALEVRAGVAAPSDLRAYILQEGDPYALKDEIRQTFLRRSWEKMRNDLATRHPRAIVLCGVRPQYHRDCLTTPHVQHAYTDVVCVERDPEVAAVVGDPDIVVGDVFDVLYDEAFKARKDHASRCSKFTLFEYDVCSQPRPDITQPVKDLVVNRMDVMTTPCCIRTIFCCRGMYHDTDRQCQALSDFIHKAADVRHYDWDKYTSTGPSMLIQQWVLD
jgi:hypothetical protein